MIVPANKFVKSLSIYPKQHHVFLYALGAFEAPFDFYNFVKIDLLLAKLFHKSIFWNY
jgi:hypothetical protein